jgi:protoheme IX farnesyltransferase
MIESPTLSREQSVQSSAPVVETVAVDAGLVDSLAVPSKLKDYYEATKPRMNYLVVVTTVVGYYIASAVAGRTLADWMLVHAIVGTALTAAGASVFNQVIERRHDTQMRRTRNRPFAAGRLSVFEGYAFATLLGVSGVAWLAIFVNPLTATLGALTLLLYVLIYTPLKRISPLCTVIGAIPGAIPPLMGVTAIDNAITPLGWSLFAILFVWQMPHFFALALMYQDDYAGAGYQMLPSCRHGLMRTRVQIVAYSLALVPISLWPIWTSGASWGYGVVAVILGAGFLAAAYQCVRSRDRASQRRLFLYSIAYLPLLLAALMIDQ